MAIENVNKPICLRKMGYDVVALAVLYCLFGVVLLSFRLQYVHCVSVLIISLLKITPFFSFLSLLFSNLGVVKAAVVCLRVIYLIRDMHDDTRAILGHGGWDWKSCLFTWPSVWLCTLLNFHYRLRQIMFNLDLMMSFFLSSIPFLF